MKKARLLPCLAIFFIILKAQGQDPEFTQTMCMPMYFNPAFAGIQENLRLASPVRNQWPSVSGSFVTTAISADMGFPKIRSGIGLILMNDQAGDGKLSTGSINATYAYEIPLALGSYLRLGLQGGMFKRTIDFSQLRFGDQIDPKTGFIYNTQEKLPAGGLWSTPWIPNFSFGALYYNQVLYGGLGVYNITEPYQSFFGNTGSNLNRRYVAQAGCFLGWGNYFINPNILAMRQGNFTQVLTGVNVSRGKFTVGTSFRMTDPNADAVNFLVGFATGIFKIGYSYDMTVSDARAAAAGSHELTVVFQLKKPRDVSDKPMIGYLREAF